MTYSEAPLSVNFKPGTGYDAPLLTIRANDPSDLELRVNAVGESQALGAIVNLQNTFKGLYNITDTLGATVVEQVTTPAPAAPAPAPAQGGFPAPAGWTHPNAQAQAAPAPVAAPAAAPAASAGAPFIPAFGMAATFRSGQGARGPWSAYFDPRPKQVTDAIPADHTGKAPSTDDPNHPGLAAGTHKFAKFLR